MRRTLLAFFALIFMAYMLWNSETPSDRQASLNPVLPSIVRHLPWSSRDQAATAQPKMPAAGGATEMKHWLDQEALKVGRIDHDPASTTIRLKRKALSLAPSDIEFLKSTSIDPANGADERFLAIYMIGLSESAAAKSALREVSETPIPPTSNDRAYSDEVVIRAHAMESLVQRQNQEESLQYLKDLLSKTTDASIAKHARYLLTKL